MTYFFVLMVQVCTFDIFISLEWANKRDILCGSERTSTLTIGKLRGEVIEEMSFVDIVAFAHSVPSFILPVYDS